MGIEEIESPHGSKKNISNNTTTAIAEQPCSNDSSFESEAIEYNETGGRICPSKPSFLRIVFEYNLITLERLHYRYTGKGTLEDPFVCEYLPNDPKNPHNWSQLSQWVICMAAATTVFVVASCSSAYTGSPGLMDRTHRSQ
jgi:hypothetical protein